MEVTSAFQTLLEQSLDFLFPKRCLGCFEEGEWICAQCFLRLPVHYQQECFFCHRPSTDGRFCFSCASEHALTGVLVNGVYADAFLRVAIQTLKYHGVRDLVTPLTSLLHHSLYSFFEHEGQVSQSSWVVVPVPLAIQRLRARGFNQSFLLAEKLVVHFSLPLFSALERTRFIQPQTELSHEERRASVRDAFLFRSGFDLHDRSVLLVDDVITTGSTLDACARVLKHAGAKEVWGVALASG